MFRKKKTPTAEQPPPTETEVEAETPAETHGPPPAPTDIREFIYLDQVSVYSLASGAGQPMVVGEVETLGSNIRNNTTVDAGLTAGIAKLASTFDTQDEHTTTFQVEARYNIQSTFAELRTRVADKTLLRHTDADLPIASSTTELSEQLDDLRAAGAAVRVNDLSRGTLVELPIKLEPHDAYTVRSVVSEMRAMSEAAPNLLKVPTGQFSVREIAGFMDWMLGGLVPIEGHATAHELVDVGGQTWVIQSRLLSQVRNDLTNVRPLTVAGMTQADLYWKDIRRTVFASQTYTVMGRVGRPGIHPTWDAVKTLGALRRVIPDERMLDGLTHAFSLGQADAEEKTASVAIWCLDFYIRLATAFGQTPTVSPHLFEFVESVASEDLDLTSRNVVLRQVADLFFKEHDTVDRDSALEAKTRSDTLADHGLLVPTAATDATVAGSGTNVDILELELVAAYW